MTKKQKKERNIIITPTESFINKLLGNPVAFRDYSEILRVANTAAIIPVTNAWPERGGSVMKLIKTRLWSRLKNDMLNSRIQVAINSA